MKRGEMPKEKKIKSTKVSGRRLAVLRRLCR